MTKTKRTRAPVQAPRPREGRSELRACYNGCMLGFILVVLTFRHYEETYRTHRRRVLEFLEEAGVRERLPVRHRDYVENHVAIQEAVLTQLQEVAPRCCIWAVLAANALWFAVYRAFGRPAAAASRRAAALVLDSKGLPHTLLSDLARAIRPKRKGQLSWRQLHSAALALLNEIVKTLRPARRTVFVAMPFSVRRMVGHYGTFYSPLVRLMGYEPLRAWGGFGTEDYQELLYSLIDRCGGMLADLTRLNPNVMHEVGYALGRGNMLVVPIVESGQPVPSNLSDVTVMTYERATADWQSKAAHEIAGVMNLVELTLALKNRNKRARRRVGMVKILPDE